MNYFLEKTLNEISAEVQQTLGVESKVVVQAANAKFDSDIAIPCFAFAKELGKNPAEIADLAARELKNPALERTQAIGGFLNIWLKPGVLLNELVSDLNKASQNDLKFGEHDLGRGKTVIVEFPSPNLAKPFGVGHMRPATQGWAMYKIMSAMGYAVVRDNHIGDWGTPFGKWVVGVRLYSSEEQLQKDGIYELARVYIKITAEMKNEAEEEGHELADQVQEALLALERGDEEMTKIAKRFTAISMDHIHKVQKRFGIETDEEIGESFYIPEGKRMVKQLVKDGIAKQQEDGSIVVPLDEYGIDTPMLVQKSNGAALYATSDIATLKYRWERWHPAKVIYMVGAEQTFHFQQIFAFAKKAGFDQMELKHLSWGLIDQIAEDGTRGKMSSRKGTVLLEELIDKAEAYVKQRVGSEDKLSQKDISKIAIGAIKFADFAADRQTGMLFDWDNMFNLQGFSSPYIQYAGVRINAILQRFGRVEAIEPSNYDWQAEKTLLWHLHNFPVIVREAAEYYEAHKIAQFAYDLARDLNRYYEEVSIVDSKDAIRGQRLWLLSQIQEVHTHALDLLGIEVPSKM